MENKIVPNHIKSSDFNSPIIYHVLVLNLDHINKIQAGLTLYLISSTTSYSH